MGDDEQSDRAHNHTRRLFRLARLLRTGPASLKELAQTLGGSLAELERNLTELQQLEPDLQVIPGRPARYVIAQHQPLALSAADLLALQDSAALLAQRAGEQHAHQASLARQLQAGLPPHVQLTLSQLNPSVPERQRPSRLERHLQVVTSAWLNLRALRFQYLKPGSREKRTCVLHPYLIYTHPLSLEVLVVGRDTSQHDELRTFCLSRMLKLQVQEDQPYSVPTTFNPADLVHPTWGPRRAAGQPTVTVELRFTGEAKYRILEGGHANLSEPVINPDASLDVTLEAPLDSTGLPRSVLPWILSWGAGVDILSPAPLRAYWHHTLSRALDTASREPQRFLSSGAA